MTALTTQVYNPGAHGIFEVSSTLVTGARDAVLINAQFSTVDAQKLVDMIRASGKRLTTIFISHGDPDFYFGLVTLVEAFPEARVLATPQTIAYIRKSSEGKLKYWGPILGAGAPSRVVVPEALHGDVIELEGEQLQIVGLDGPTPDRTFVWIPSGAPWPAVSRCSATSTCGWPTRKARSRRPTGWQRWSASRRCSRRPWFLATSGRARR